MWYCSNVAGWKSTVECRDKMWFCSNTEAWRSLVNCKEGFLVQGHTSKNLKMSKISRIFWCMVTVYSPSHPIWDPFSAHGDRGYVTILAPALRPPPLSFLVKSHLVKSKAFKEMCYKSKILACFFLIKQSSLANSILALINLYLNKVFGFSFNKLLVRNDLKW